MGQDIIPPDMAALKRGIFWQSAFKLDWAEYQFQYALALLNDYTENGGIGIRERRDEQAQVYITELFAELLPQHLPLAIGTGIHSLRSALDTAVSVIIREAGGRPDTRVSFPFHATEREMRAAFEVGSRTCPDCGTVRTTKAAMAQIRNLAPDLERLVFEEFHPWEAGNYPLWALNRLDNLQKHQMLLTVLTTTSGTLDYRSAEGVFSKYNLYRVGPGMVVELARSRLQLMVSNPPAVASELRFPEGVPFAGELVFEVLTQLFKLVRGVLVTLQTHFEGEQTTSDGRT